MRDTDIGAQPLAYLINSFQQENFRLFQCLSLLNKQDTNFVQDQLVQNEVLDNFQYRFDLPGIQAVANDVYPVWKQVRFPLDHTNNTIGKGQKITRIDINAKVAPVGSNFIADILVTKDKGVTFNSIFPGTNAQKLVLPIGLSWIKYGGTFALATDTLQDGWWFRIDVLQADGTVAGVEVVIRGILDLG